MKTSEATGWFAVFLFPTVLFALAGIDLFMMNTARGQGWYIAGLIVTGILIVANILRNIFLAGRNSR